MLEIFHSALWGYNVPFMLEFKGGVVFYHQTAAHHISKMKKPPTNAVCTFAALFIAIGP